MLARVLSSAILGLDAYPVEVEVDISPGLPYFVIVGLPDTAVSEARERVRSAIRNQEYDFPARRITVNLAPADIRKEGPSFDLSIALGILAATEQISPRRLQDMVVLGELSLDGRVREINGVLPMAIAARNHESSLIVPARNFTEACLVDGLEVFPVESLKEACAVLEGRMGVPARPEVPQEDPAATSGIDFGDVKGQEHAKRALEVAAAGGHNVLMIGPPGSGKTMLARRLPTILPPMTMDEALEVTKVYSIAGLLRPGKCLIRERPFRSPHHSASPAGLIGGGSIPRPGEVSLAHRGVLFLDELPEFPRAVLEVLRQPMESGTVTISRAAVSLSYPASIMLVASMNPCPCGYYFDPVRECACTQTQIRRYMMKISGPLLDRIDIHLEVPRLKVEELVRHPPGENSSVIRERVSAARARQQERFRHRKIRSNAQMRSREIREFCVILPEAQELLRLAVSELGLSARAYDRILKLARSIADLAGRDDIRTEDVAEAIQYRSLDRKMWG